MAQTFPTNSPWKILPSDNGNIGILGVAGPMTQGGVIAVDFITDPTWQGSLAVMGRTIGFPSSDPTGFVPIPFRAAFLNDAVVIGASGAPDWSFVPAQTLLTGRSLIQIPTNGIEVAVLVACVAGFATLYKHLVQGAAPI